MFLDKFLHFVPTAAGLNTLQRNYRIWLCPICVCTLRDKTKST